MSDDVAPLSRRTFALSLAATGAAGAAALTVGPRVVSSLPTVAMRVSQTAGVPLPFASLAGAAYEDWLREIGSIFTTAEGVSLRLIAVTALVSPGTRPRSVTRNRAFVAKFDVMGGRLLTSDGIRQVTHVRSGRFPLYLSANARGARVSAVFN